MRNLSRIHDFQFLQFTTDLCDNFFGNIGLFLSLKYLNPLLKWFCLRYEYETILFVDSCSSRYVSSSLTSCESTSPHDSHISVDV